MVLIVHSGGSIAPNVVDGFTSDRETRTVVHPILGRTYPDISFRPAAARTGTLSLVFGDEAASSAAEIVFTLPRTFTLSAPERPTLNGLKFIVSGGAVSRELDYETRAVWIVSVPFVEVLE